MQIEREKNMNKILDSAFSNETLVSVSDASSCLMSFAKMLPEMDIYEHLVEAAGEDASENFVISLIVSLIGTLDMNFKQDMKNTA